MLKNCVLRRKARESPLLGVFLDERVPERVSALRIFGKVFIVGKD